MGRKIYTQRTHGHQKKYCNLVWKLIYKYLWFAAAILNIRLPVTSGSIRNRAIELLDPEKGG